MKLLLVTLLLFARNFVCEAQLNDFEDSKRYIKIVIDSDITQDSQLEITNAFRQIPGVRTSRMDNTNRTFLGIYEPNENLLEQTFTNWFVNHGYTIKCYYDAVYTAGNMIELSKNNCH
jgi:hypothetical protein